MQPVDLDKLIVYDLEIYPNHALAGFQYPDGRVVQYRELELSALEAQIDHWYRQGYHLIGFNSHGYDDSVLKVLLQDAHNPNAAVTNAYARSVAIIEQEEREWLPLRRHWRTLDIMPLVKGKRGLKMLGVCLGWEKLQELPFDPHRPLDVWQRKELAEYNINDLRITRELVNHFRKALELRNTMSQEYGLDLMSRSDAQIAEDVLVAKSGQDKQTLKAMAAQPTSIQVHRPYWWPQFNGSEEVSRVKQIGEEIFGNPVPIYSGRVYGKAMERVVFVGDRYYTMGVGGLHSFDGPGCWLSDDKAQLFDIDVASYYPSLMLTLNNFPRHWGSSLAEIYRHIYDERLAAKAAGDKGTADTLKIVLNGTYGKTSDIYSTLYDPECTATVTLNGQLALLLLIARLEEFGMQVVSANTDGLTVLTATPVTMKEIVSEWEEITGLAMEDTAYRGLYQRDVNNYIAVKLDGSIKAKGVFVQEWPDLEHNPSAMIVARAVAGYLAEGTMPEQTIRECRDLNLFLYSHQASRGWTVMQGSEDLGRIVRWYMSTDESVEQMVKINLEDNRVQQVPDSAGGRPVQDLPETFPADVDYDYYIRQAEALVVLLTHRKQPHLNWWAEKHWALGLPIGVTGMASRLSRRTPIRGKIDYSSMQEGDVFGLKTGNGIMAKVVDGEVVEVFRVKGNYPSKTRDLIERDYGFTLYYGPMVPFEPWMTPILHEQEINEAEKLRPFYTEAELRKAEAAANRRPKNA